MGCENCSACCYFTDGVPPFASKLEKEYKALPEHLKKEFEKTLYDSELRGRYKPCMWLDTVSKRCKHYENRPKLCRTFKEEGSLCKELKEAYKTKVPQNVLLEV